jgi:hypothetical protein
MLTCCVDNPRPLGCPQMKWGRTLKKALQSHDLPTEFVKWREIAADRNQWRVVCGSKIRVQQKRHRPPHHRTSELSFITALNPHEYKCVHSNSMSDLKAVEISYKGYLDLHLNGSKTRFSLRLSSYKLSSLLWESLKKAGRGRS